MKCFRIGLWIGFGFGVLYALGGFFIDLLVSLDLLAAAQMETPGLSYGTILAFGALVGMPLIGAGFGLFIGFVVDFIKRYFVGK